MQPPDVIILSRHAEKPDPDKGIVGVDHTGRTDEHSLSVRGGSAPVRWRRCWHTLPR